MVDKDVFRELKIKMAIQKHDAMIKELKRQLAQNDRALSLSIYLNKLQESELLKYKIMEAGYSEGE